MHDSTRRSFVRNSLFVSITSSTPIFSGLVRACGEGPETQTCTTAGYETTYATGTYVTTWPATYPITTWPATTGIWETTFAESTVPATTYDSTVPETTILSGWWIICTKAPSVSSPISHSEPGSPTFDDSLELTCDVTGPKEGDIAPAATGLTIRIIIDAITKCTESASPFNSTAEGPGPKVLLQTAMADPTTLDNTQGTTSPDLIFSPDPQYWELPTSPAFTNSLMPDRYLEVTGNIAGGVVNSVWAEWTSGAYATTITNDLLVRAGTGNLVWEFEFFYVP